MLKVAKKIFAEDLFAGNASKIGSDLAKTIVPTAETFLWLNRFLSMREGYLVG